MAEPTLQLIDLTRTIYKDNFLRSRNIRIPGQKSELSVKIPWTEGHSTNGAEIHTRLMEQFDSFVSEASYSGQDMTYKMKDDVVPNDVKSAFSKDSTELLLTFEDDNNDGLLFGSGFMCSTVGNGVRLKIGDHGELTVEVLKKHRIDDTYFFGHEDGRDEDEAIIEDLLVAKNRELVYKSDSGQGEKGSNAEGKEFFENLLKYFGKELGIEYDYELEVDPTFSPDVQKKTLDFVKNYFMTLDHHIRHGANKEPYIRNFESVLPMVVKQLGYDSDEVSESDGDIGKNLKQTRTLLLEALKLEPEDNLVSYLAGYYGLDKVSEKSGQKEKLTELETIFSRVRGLLLNAPDFDRVADEYSEAYAKAVKDRLGINAPEAEIERLLKQYIVSSERIDGFDDSEITRFIDDLKQFDTSSNSLTTPPKTIEADWAKQALTLSKDSSANSSDKLVGELIVQNQDQIDRLLKQFPNLDDSKKRDLVLHIIKRAKPESFGTTLITDDYAKTLINRLFGTK